MEVDIRCAMLNHMFILWMVCVVIGGCSCQVDGHVFRGMESSCVVCAGWSCVVGGYMCSG